MRIQKKVFWLIGIATIIRSIVALSIGLGNDEVYYLTYAQHLQWNYFDHPPMVALLIRLTTLNLTVVNDFTVRLGAIILSALNTYVVYKLVAEIKNEKTGFIAGLLFSSSIYSSIIAGIFILPDTPQLFFWLISLYALVGLVKNEENSKNIALLLFGITSGLCIMSKVHGVFLWFALGAYVVFYRREWFKNPYVYLSAVITTVIISPILIWNIQNNFITYTFHSQRVTPDGSVHFSGFLREFFGGFLYNNPINYVLIIIALVSISKGKIQINLETKRILLLCSLPLIVILLLVSWFRDTLPHWSGPGYVTLSVLASVYVSEKSKLGKIAVYSCCFIALIAFAGVLLIRYYPGTLGSKDALLYGKGDFTLDMYDWSYFRDEFKKKRQLDIQSGVAQTTFVISNQWFPGSHIDNYMVQPLGLDFVALGTLEDIHTYHWLNGYRKTLQKGDDAYFVTISNNFVNPNEIYAETFQKIGQPFVIRQFRNHELVRKMYVYLLRGYRG